MYKITFKREDVDYIEINPNAKTSYNPQYWHVSVYFKKDRDCVNRNDLHDLVRQGLIDEELMNEYITMDGEFAEVEGRFPAAFAFDKQKKMLEFIKKIK